MIRLLLRLFKITDFETCRSCETLKQQLEIANREKAEAIETLISLVKPVVIPTANPIIETKPLKDSAIPWSQRRRMLEEEDRNKARVLAQQKQNIDKLEQMLNIEATERSEGAENAVS